MILLDLFLGFCLGVFIGRWQRRRCRDRSPVRLLFFTHGRQVDYMKLKVTQTLPLSIKPVDAKGNPATVDGAPQWSVSDPTLATITPAADGLSAVLVPLGPLGSLAVQVSADGDLGEGVKTIVGTAAVDLIGGDAVSVEIVAGTPIDS